MPLHPDLQSLLKRFERKRRRILLGRACLTAAITLLAGIGLGALLDLRLVFDERSRVAASLCIYATTFVAVWVRAGRQFILRGSDADAATALEHLQPALKGDLLSAVELARGEDESTDSPVFRELHQQRTAENIKNLSISSVLNWRTLRLEMLTGVSMACIILAFLGAGGTRIGRLYARLLLPFARIERISETNISITAPAPCEGMVPANEPVEFIIQAKSSRPLRPMLRVDSDSGDSLSVEMEPIGKNQFKAKVPVGMGPIKYSFRAGDAVTRHFRLFPKERPRIEVYTREYQYPNYLELPPKTETSIDGNITALEGSTIGLTIQANQPVSSGSITVTQGDATETQSLKRSASDSSMLTASLEMKKSGWYSVHLIGESTAFVSKPDVKNAIAVEPDAPPTVTLESPLNDVVLPLGESLAFKGFAEDDFLLVALFQESSLNQGSWKAAPLDTARGKYAEIRYLWDSLEQHPNIGDVISVRFAAVDSRNQRTESRTVKIAIAPSGISPKAPASYLWKRNIHGLFEDISRHSTEAARALQEAKKEMDSRSPSIVKRTQALDRAQEELEKAMDSSGSAEETLLTTLQGEESIAALSKLKLQFQSLAKMQHGQLEPAQRELDAFNAAVRSGNISGQDQEGMRFATESAAKAAGLANMVKDFSQALLAFDTLEILANTGDAMVRDEKSNSVPASQPDTQPAGAEAVRRDGDLQNFQNEALRHQQINQATAAVFQKQLQSFAELSPVASGKLKAARSALGASQQNAERLLKAAQSDAAKPQAPISFQKALEAGDGLERQIKQVTSQLRSLQPDLQEVLQKAEMRLRNDQIFNAEGVFQTAREMDVLESRKQLSAAEKSGLARNRLQSEAAVLRAKAAMEASRKNASDHAAYDLQLSAEILDSAAMSDGSLVELKTKADGGARSLQTLEAVGKIEETLRNLESLAETKYPEGTETRLSSTDVRKETLEQLQRLSPELRRAGLPEAAIEAAAAAQGAMLSGAESGLAEARQFLRSGVDASHESMQQALSNLMKLAPSVSARMESLASKSEHAADLSRALRMTGEETAESATSEAVKQAMALKRQLDNLRNELLFNASRQNLMTEEGRKSARDADGAAAHFGDTGRAVKLLQKASHSKTEAKQMLENAEDLQRQTANHLRQLAEHFQNIEDDNRERISQSRKKLREREAHTGSQKLLEERETSALTISELATASIQGLQSKLEEALSSRAKRPASNASPNSSSSQVSGEAETAIQNALAALKNGHPEDALQSAHMAASAHQEAVRLARSKGETSASGGDFESSASDSRGLPTASRKGGDNWGRLPKRVANDLMEGKREQAPNEYKAAVDAYFQAIAEKARSTTQKP